MGVVDLQAPPAHGYSGLVAAGHSEVNSRRTRRERKGKFWSPAVDGEKSKNGIGRIVIDKDTKLSWTIWDAQAN